MLKIVLRNAKLTAAAYATIGRIVCNVSTEELGGMSKHFNLACSPTTLANKLFAYD